MTHISVLFIYYVTKFFVQGNQHTTNRVSIAIVIMMTQTDANGYVFDFAESPITNAQQSVLYIPSPISTL